MENSQNTFAPLILTLKLDAESFAFFDALRQKHFPAERNFLKAHVTMFHHLPGVQKAKIEADLREVSAQHKSFELRFPKPRFLGRGTAFEIKSGELYQNQKGRLVMQKPARSKGVNEVALTSCGLLHLLTHIFNLYWY